MRETLPQKYILLPAIKGRLGLTYDLLKFLLFNEHGQKEMFCYVRHLATLSPRCFVWSSRIFCLAQHSFYVGSCFGIKMQISNPEAWLDLKRSWNWLQIYGVHLQAFIRPGLPDVMVFWQGGLSRRKISQKMFLFSNFFGKPKNSNFVAIPRQINLLMYRFVSLSALGTFLISTE